MTSDIPVMISIEVGTGTLTNSDIVVLSATGAGELGPLRATLATALVLLGAFFLTVGTVGLIRMPDMYNRMHATTKASSLGAVSLFLAAFVVFGPGGNGLTALVGIVFLFLTVPAGSHMLLRSALRMGVPFYGEDISWPDEE
jgi:multicomponent Na+:H+ antiporter subunit G